jgi:hypothetical protein
VTAVARGVDHEDLGRVARLERVDVLGQPVERRGCFLTLTRRPFLLKLTR